METGNITSTFYSCKSVKHKGIEPQGGGGVRGVVSFIYPCPSICTDIYL